MPIYEYHCEKCETVFEKLVFAGDEEEIFCPKCHSKEVNKIMSACSFMGASIGTCAADAPKGFS
ncbi:putative regulatory protein, FmdB family [Desulfocicer vacuolatum DSM 3385]|uniref:Putative regulatory protein, FmdB family n=1 Tax=Desulfocicer vacuolatum DSM 3385 TaxID=1121400 RepID=A0A1W2B0F4_9BACT|nr:zinc ribbon domain-containing protein [Desulfocicer vacuolatum]SMC66202.1 putative regulatory protein, FmdB family [Desulfocicer vacuolatum DSM 3385]